MRRSPAGRSWRDCSPRVRPPAPSVPTAPRSSRPRPSPASAVPSTTNLPASLPAGLFTLGVASGDPLADSVILWTRLAPAPLAGGGLPDRRHPRRVGGGRGRRLPAAGGGGRDGRHAGARPLRPCRRGRPRRAAPSTSTGSGSATRRARSATRRTAPTPDDEPDGLRFAFASCQNYQDGLLHGPSGHRRGGLDLVVFLGDYIYEGGPQPDRLRPHATAAPADIAGYRNRYAEYKARSRPPGGPRRGRRGCARSTTTRWSTTGRVPSPTAARPLDLSPEAFAALRAAAFQAYYEHLPAAARALGRRPPSSAIHRSIDWGRLARFHVLDTRQYRDDQPCGLDGDAGTVCPEVDEPGRTMLGPGQEAWLGTAARGSEAVWDVLAQQVVVTPITVTLGAQPAARPRPVGRLPGGPPAAGRPSGRLGTIRHGHRRHPRRRARRGPRRSPPAGRHARPRRSSWSPRRSPPRPTTRTPALVETAAAVSPGVRYADARHRGYVLCDLTPDRLTGRVRTVDTSLGRRHGDDRRLLGGRRRRAQRRAGVTTPKVAAWSSWRPRPPHLSPGAAAVASRTGSAYR